MTKKDVVLIASVIAAQNSDDPRGYDAIDGLACDLADALENDAGSRYFDRAKFLEACGVSVDG